jgi:molecular chaperone GrpE
MAQRNRNDFDSTGDSSDSNEAIGRPGGDLGDGVEQESLADADTAGTGASEATAELARKLAEAQDRFLRQAAEYDNYRKRTIKERTELVPRAQADLVRQLLDPLDDLARFAHVDPTTVDAATVVQGAELVEKKLHKALGAAGLEVVDPVNQTFDPQFHEAVATEPALSAEDDHVVARVYQVGYKFNGQLLRPARVVVKQWNG